jgi:hypothetical protein
MADKTLETRNLYQRLNETKQDMIEEIQYKYPHTYHSLKKVLNEEFFYSDLTVQTVGELVNFYIIDGYTPTDLNETFRQGR